MSSANASRSPPRLEGAEWLVRPQTCAVFAAIEAGGHEARAVGGAVRNALLGLPVTDVDLATTALPKEVMRLASAAGLGAHPTGIGHGTVTVVSGGVPIEVTTLRQDVETHGRRATVAFTTDWSADAHRRDFTINALYCGSDGTVYDPVSGYSDVLARRVRFIGDPRARIREDFLRILRFFRFTAEYAAGAPEAEGLAACVAEMDGLGLLSAERIRAELLRLLAAPRAVEIAGLMADLGFLTAVLGRKPDVTRLDRLQTIERTLGRQPDPVLRLAALAGKVAGSPPLAERLRLSNAEAERLAHFARPDPVFEPSTPEHDAKAFIYRHKSAAFFDGALGAWVRSGDPSDDAARRDRVGLAETWRPPELPFRGADILALGVLPGPRVGQALAQFEDWWIAEGFPAEPERLRGMLREIALGS